MNVYVVKELERLFKEQYEYGKKIEDADGHCLCTMPVKSGKRIVMEILSQRSRNSIPPKEQHVFITALNRRDTTEQLEELEQYGIKIIPVNRERHIPKAQKVIEGYAKIGLKVIVHFDESDYGTGSEQLMHKVFETLLKFNGRCKVINYSATNEEAEFSLFGEAAVKLPPFVPHPTYRGAAWFLDEKLVIRPTPFYDNGLTKQGQEACDYFAKSDKAISVLRIVDGFKEQNDQFYAELLKYKIEPVFVDANRSFKWRESYKKYVARFEAGMGRTLLVICQTCSRSTEVGFHKHICFWHDYRSEGTAYNTMHQAFLRVAHYHKDGEADNSIRVYALPEVFELAANRITFEQFEAAGYKLSDRIKKHSEGNQYEMKFAKGIDDIPDNAYFGEGRTREEYFASWKGGSKVSEQGKIDNGIVKGNNLARAVLLGTFRGNNPIIFVDKANPIFQTDWDELEKVKPEVVGGYAYYVPVVPVKTAPKTKESSMFQKVAA